MCIIVGNLESSAPVKPVHEKSVNSAQANDSSETGSKGSPKPVRAAPPIPGRPAPTPPGTTVTTAPAAVPQRPAPSRPAPTRPAPSRPAPSRPAPTRLAPTRPASARPGPVPQQVPQILGKRWFTSNCNDQSGRVIYLATLQILPLWFMARIWRGH